MKIITPIILVLGIVAIFKIQFSVPTLWEADGYYHIRMAETIRTEGVVKKFPWAKYSFFETHFADKDFLCHILLIPFTLFSSIFYGAKVAAAFYAVLLFLTFFFILRRYAASEFVPLFLILFFLSDHFLSAISRPRPMTPAITLMLL